MDANVMSEFTITCLKLFYYNYSLSTFILMVCIMSAVFGLVQLVKKLIKHYTKNIKNEKLRKLANKSIILSSFIISIGIWFLLNLIIPSIVKIDWVSMFLTGAMPVVAHALYDGVITKEQAKSAVSDIENITKDGKIDKNDQSAVKEFLDKVK